MDRRPLLPALTLALLTPACATYWQASALEEKVDQLIKNTQRATMQELFGEQSLVLTEKMEAMSAEEKGKVDELLTEYQKGSASIDEVRASVLGVMGGPDRVVSSSGGIWVRGTDGKKMMTIGRNTKIKGCARLSEEEIPATIAANKGLKDFSWGKGEVNGKEIIFPWELTMSSFAKEIVENTARRTAQEVVRMAGDRGWNRPVYIQVVTEPKQNLTINHPGAENEVFVTTPGQVSPTPLGPEPPPEEKK